MKDFTLRSGRMAIRILLLSFLGAFAVNVSGQSIAMEWNECQLNCIRKDGPRPTVQARNLAHAAIVMWDAWAAYDDSAKPFLLGNTWGGFSVPFDGVPIPDDVQAAREKAISYAMYRLLNDRYKPGLSPAANIPLIQGYINAEMAEHGYDPAITSTDYTDGDPAKLGNYIAAQMQLYALQDGINQAANYANQYYAPVNGQLFAELPGNPNQVDPNRWQSLCLTLICAQCSEPGCECIPVPCNAPALTPEMGNVNPFCLEESDMETFQRDGHDWNIYVDQGWPPLLDTINYTDETTSFFKWGYAINTIWHSLHDPNDGVWVDISPNATGNVQWYPEVGNFEEYQDFYNMFEGGDPGTGYAVNPATGQPYAEQWVRRGDYTRVLSEFWADGPTSETPPGHWFTVINSKVTSHPDFEKRWMGTGPELDDLEWDVRAYLALGGAVFDAAVACWSAKGYYDYTRPIMAIRYMADHGQSSDPLLPNYNPAGLPLIPGYIEMIEAGDPLAGIDGEHIGKVKVYSWAGPPAATGLAGVDWIRAESWWTYQKHTFVTPPFPGYMSGHSTFSRSAAEVLTQITGDEYFPGGYAEFVAPKLTYLGAEVGPVDTIRLQWAKYYDASDQCSLSRIYGGLHPPQDDIPGRMMGMYIGPKAVGCANECIEAGIPHIIAVTPSAEIINDAVAQTGTFSVTVSFNEAMNSNFIPTIELINDDPSVTLTYVDGAWTNTMTYVINYTVADMNITQNNVVWKISGAVGQDSQMILPALSDIVRIDTQNPTILSWTGEDWVTDVTAVAGTTQVTIVFDEAMDTDVAPVISFPGEDPSNTATFTGGSWSDDMTYVANFNIVDVNEEVLDIDVMAITATDAAGNEQIVFTTLDVFNIDTKNPSVTATVNSDNLLSDIDEGTAFTVTLTFDEAMSMDMDPVITWSDDLTGSIEWTSGTWSDNMTYVATYNALDNNIEINDIDVMSASAIDAAGNLQVMSTEAAAFSIDTFNPSVIDSATDLTIIADANEGGENFLITLDFDDEMSGTPEITFSENIASTLTLETDGWMDSDTYFASYNVADAGVEVWDIDIEAINATDDAGNNQEVDFNWADAFDIDTKNPQVLLLTANTYNITSVNAEPGGFTITALFDEAMNSAGANEPVVSFPDEDPTTVISYASGPSVWVNGSTWTAEYNVDEDLVTIPDVDVEITNGKDAAGNDAVDYSIADFFDIHTVVGVNELGEGFEGIVVYPNPVNAGNDIMVAIEKLPSGLRVETLDMAGRVIESLPFTTESGMIRINTSTLAAGMYVVRLVSTEGMAEFKVTVN